MSLALMVAGDEKVPKGVRDVILIHVAGVALLTLLINATTTAILVRALGLNHYSDLKKNILFSVSMQMDQQMDETIRQMKTEKNFRQVDWEDLAEQVKMTETQQKICNCSEIELSMGNDQIINLRTSTLDKNSIELAYSGAINPGLSVQNSDSFR